MVAANAPVWQKTPPCERSGTVNETPTPREEDRELELAKWITAIKQLIETARAAYAEARTPVYGETLARYGYGATDLEEAEGSLVRLSLSEEVERRRVGAAQEATEDENAAVQRLAGWIRQLADDNEDLFKESLLGEAPGYGRSVLVDQPGPEPWDGE
jgi:hypothetical protein